MNKNILIISVAILAVVGILGFSLGRMTAPTQTKIAQQFGATSPDIASPYMSVGGIRDWYAHTEALTQATTTVCALQSPSATSTLTRADITFVVSSTTASTITIAKASSAFATTTLLGTTAIVANGYGTAIASTTQDSTSIFSPNQWVVVGMAGGQGNFSPTGICQASWRQLNY